MARRGAPDQWQARAPFWISLAVSAMTGFVTVKVQLAGLEARQAVVTHQRDRDIDDLRTRMMAERSRCP